MPFAERAVLAGLYQEQDQLKGLLTIYTAGILAPVSSRNTPEFRRDQIKSIAMFLSDIVSSEQRLLEQYAEAEKRLRAAGSRDR